VDPYLTSLAAAGAATIVNAVATDTWAGVKSGFSRLFGQGDEDRAIVVQRRLDSTEGELVELTDADLGAAREQAELRWRGRLADFLEDHPGAVTELRQLIDAMCVPGSASQPGVSVAGNASVTASQGGAAALTMRNVTIGAVPVDPTRPGQHTG
jgi:hypothetical protein